MCGRRIPGTLEPDLWRVALSAGISATLGFPTVAPSVPVSNAPLPGTQAQLSSNASPLERFKADGERIIAALQAVPKQRAEELRRLATYRALSSLASDARHPVSEDMTAAWNHLIALPQLLPLLPQLDTTPDLQRHIQRHLAEYGSRNQHNTALMAIINHATDGEAQCARRQAALSLNVTQYRDFLRIQTQAANTIFPESVYL